MDSIWPQTAQLPEFDPLRSDLNTDVLIIGGGMAGLLCAYKLAQSGVDYSLVETDRICGSLLPFPDGPSSAAGGERTGIYPGAPDPHRAPLSPYGLRPKVQRR